MTNRVIEISEGPVRLRIENGLLVVEKKDSEPRSIPLDDLAVLILATAQASYTHSVLSEAAKRNVAVVLFDEKSMPLALLAPLAGHSLHPQTLRLQIAALQSRPLVKRLWKGIIAAKVRAQGAVLQRLDGSDGGVALLARRVRSGDASNVEAQAARAYWPRLFRLESFRREPGAPIPPNHLLDYGYAVLRGILARAVVGAGLHPALGIHHRHRENACALADDLMEPFRPLVDETVARMVRSEGPELPLDRERKRRLIEPLLGRYTYREEQRTLFDIASMMAAQLVRIFAGDEADLEVPLVFG
ncbi:MAG: type II CRISPR-associated endonuclease Cas1 [Kiritimatiellae bacterium]|nr:type II CRISPR-associated endonuclease Cas1 [Kiritimatiellia bacterium]MDW8458910.1 type II CRISPR-associated endonuclease Cas1 [Verrucomicrobiota bacterium]